MKKSETIIGEILLYFRNSFHIYLFSPHFSQSQSILRKPQRLDQIFLSQEQAKKQASRAAARSSNP